MRDRFKRRKYLGMSNARTWKDEMRWEAMAWCRYEDEDEDEKDEEGKLKKKSAKVWPSSTEGICKPSATRHLATFTAHNKGESPRSMETLVRFKILCIVSLLEPSVSMAEEEEEEEEEEDRERA